MRRAPSTPSANSLATSLDPAEWSPEYRDLAARIALEHAAALRGEEPIAPPILEIHPGPVCPASCRFCPTRGPKVYPAERRRALLTADELKLLVKEFAALGGRQLILSGGLEPLTGPALPAAEAAHEAGLRVHLYTSGLSPVLDDPETRRALLAHVARIRFSVNGFSEETYAEVQLGGRHGPPRLERVKTRADSLARDRDALGSGCEIGLSVVVVPANRGEAPAALAFARRAGLDFVDFLVDIGHERTVEGEVSDALDDLRRTARDGSACPRVRVSGRTGVSPALTRGCAAPSVKLAIDPFGLVWRCCHVANPEISSPELLLGDVREGGVLPILRSERARPLEPGCRTCPDFERTFNALAAIRSSAAPRIAISD